MIKFMLIVIGCLVVISTMLIVYIHQLKQQIKKCCSETEKLKNLNYNQIIKVDIFEPDIVELVNALNELIEFQIQIKKQYIEERKRLKEIITGISHDFRTPLTVSKGYLQMLEKRGVLNGEEAAYLKIIIKKTNYLMEMADDFFEVSLFDANESEVEIQELNLSNLLTEIILEQNLWVEAQKVQGTFDILDETVMIRSNAYYLRRIIENIFSNAKKYVQSEIGVNMKSYGDKIYIEIYNDTKENEFVDIEKVFDPFYRGKSCIREGNGLGLYVVKCLSNKLGIKATTYYKEKNDKIIFGVRLEVDKMNQ